MLDLNEKIEKLRNDFEQLLGSEMINWEEGQKLGKITGVYMIFNGEDLIYIGSTNKFSVRFKDFLHHSTHTVHRKLVDEFEDKEQINNFLKNECKYKVKVCENRRYADSLEHFAIDVLNPRLNK